MRLLGLGFPDSQAENQRDDLRVHSPVATLQAPDWQSALRQAFQSAFAMGFIAIGFARTDPSRPRYLLERAL